MDLEKRAAGSAQDERAEPAHKSALHETGAVKDRKPRAAEAI